MKRRDFLKLLGVTSVAVALSPMEAISKIIPSELRTKGQISEVYFSPHYIDLTKGNTFTLTMTKDYKIVDMEDFKPGAGGTFTRIGND